MKIKVDDSLRSDRITEEMWWELLTQDLRAEALLRIGASMVAGFVIGAEREVHGRAAGLRTTMLVCLSSCVAMLISESFYRESYSGIESTWRPDPMRLAAGILSGMGFLGAGVIIHQRTHVVRGVTTAATLWLAAILGIAIGGGAIGIAIVATGLSAIILGTFARFERLFENDWYSDLTVKLDATTAEMESIADIIRSQDITIKGLEWKENLSAGERTIIYHLKYRKSEHLVLPAKVVEKLGKLNEVRAIHWHG